MPAVDLIADGSFTVTVGRQRIELARAAICAVAVGKFLALDAPLYLGHTRAPYMDIGSQLVPVPGLAICRRRARRRAAAAAGPWSRPHRLSRPRALRRCMAGHHRVSG